MTRLFSVAARTLVVASLALLQTVPVANALSAVTGAPVVVDDFSGNHLGTRVVTLLNFDGTSPKGTFSEDGGVATMTMSGPGNSFGGCSSITPPQCQLT